MAIKLRPLDLVVVGVLGSLALHAQLHASARNAADKSALQRRGLKSDEGYGSFYSPYSPEEPHSKEPHIHPHVAILYPWFTEALGVVSYFMLSRWCPMLPYTFVLFLIGTVMGIGYSLADRWDELTQSIYMWDRINGEVLLLVFLPGLLFKDALSLDGHLFQASFVQCLIFAFPMVLAGTALIACVAYWIFPFDWSWNFCMMFGAILSATDPVAVNALLNEVGAPPRLKMHISGESLLNDGSSIVFYSIFSDMYLSELNIPGLGEEYDVGAGFELFFRMAGGGAAIGIAFGAGLILVLYNLNRRHNHEESVLQVTATIAVAYLTYYVADSICSTSGVIGVVFCGIVTKVYGNSMINQQELMTHFWAVTEHLLNTVLFALGGVVWGSTISNGGDEHFSGQEWGYLIVLYIFVMLIRFFLVFACYPITASIGLGTSWQETLFSGFGGLRGAVGIALAITIDNEVREATGTQKWTHTLFGMVGGIAFLTLLVNGTLSGPLLIKLGLADASETRKKIVGHFSGIFDLFVIDTFVHKLTDVRFSCIDFRIVRKYVPSLRNMTLEGFKEAVERNRASCPAGTYQEPYVNNVLRYFEASEASHRFDYNNAKTPSLHAFSEMLKNPHEKLRTKSEMDTIKDHHDESGKADAMEAAAESSSDPVSEAKDGELAITMGGADVSKESSTIELRQIFISVLRSAYSAQLEKGELDGRYGYTTYALLTSLDFASDHVSKGGQLDDWDQALRLSHISQRFPIRYLLGKWRALWWRIRGDEETRPKLADPYRLASDVHLALSCIGAHKHAQNRFQKEFCKHQSLRELFPGEAVVMKESETQMDKANKVLQDIDHTVMEGIVSRLMVSIVLNKAARRVDQVTKDGILKEREAHHYIEEIEHTLLQLEKDGREGDDGFEGDGPPLH